MVLLLNFKTVQMIWKGWIDWIIIEKYWKIEKLFLKRDFWHPFSSKDFQLHPLSLSRNSNFLKRKNIDVDLEQNFVLILNNILCWFLTIFCVDLEKYLLLILNNILCLIGSKSGALAVLLQLWTMTLLGMVSKTFSR